MSKTFVRHDGRRHDELRPIKVSHHVFGYAPGSILFELGNTKVLCAVTLQPGVPPFLKGQKVGWLTAEYAMLPTATLIRSPRDGTTQKKNGRAIEISRLISRSLRSVVDLTKLGERTIQIDCDVLQADGGTRTASITGAYLALEKAVEHWLLTGEITESILIDAVGAVSIGFLNETILVDLDFHEDSTIDADYNFVLTHAGKIIEIQGTAERKAINWPLFYQVADLAVQSVRNMLLHSNNRAQIAPVLDAKDTNNHEIKKTNSPKKALFSLESRLGHLSS